MKAHQDPRQDGDAAAPAGAESHPCEACCHDAQRRLALKAAAGVALAAGAGVRPAWSADDGPKTGDLLVGVDDEQKKPIGAADIKAGEKPVIVFPYDPAAKAARDGSRLNRILLVKVDPAKMDAATKGRAADGVVAYSAFCTHQGCDVNAWVAKEEALLCYCHFSKFAPHEGAAVVGGPAPRALPALPLKVADGKLVVAGGFTAPPGKAA